LKQLYSWIYKTVHYVEDYTIILALALMTLLICVSVFFRYILKDPLVGSEEVTIFLLVLMSLVGAAVVTRIKSHINIDLVPIYIRNKRFLRFLNLFLAFAGSLFGCGFSYLSYHFIITGIEGGQTSIALRIPMYLPYSTIFIGACLITIHYIFIFIRQLYEIVQK
jgi:TRAP-type C4-dicarboxylate transport system permease small subunit